MEGIIKCPRCGSAKVNYTTETLIKRGVGHAAEFGLGYGAGCFGLAKLVEDVNIADKFVKEYECGACGHIWKEGKVQQNGDNTKTDFTKEQLERIHAIDNDMYIPESELSQSQKTAMRILQTIFPTNYSFSHYCRYRHHGTFGKNHLSKIRKTYPDFPAIDVYKASSYEELIDHFADYLSTHQNQTSQQESHVNMEKENLAQAEIDVASSTEAQYLDAIKTCLSDSTITESNRALLGILRTQFGITEQRAVELEAMLTKPNLTAEEQKYFDACKGALQNGVIPGSSRRLLNMIRDMSGISENRAKEIERMIK